MSKRLFLSLLFVFAWLALANVGQSQDAKEEPKVEEKKADRPEKGDPSGASSIDTSVVGAPKERDPDKATVKDVATNLNQLIDAVGINRAGINMMWTLIAGFLVMFMQAGFAMVETGLIRAKNVAHTMAMNFMVYAIGMLAFYFVGFGLMMGNFNNAFGGGFLGASDSLLKGEFSIKLFDKDFGLFGTEGFMLLGRAFDSSMLALFLFQMVFMDTTCTIPTGTMAERWKFIAFVIFSFIIGGLIYPVYGNWVWGGGWLATLGANFGLGHGHVDFAGCSVVHMTGGVAALAGGLIIGPRIGKYNKDGSVNALPAHNIPMYMVGTFILAFGWFGFNAGSTLRGTDLNIARIAVNTMLASAAGAFTAMVYMWVVYKKPDPSFMCNGMLAGLVAITAPCAFVSPLFAVIIGGIAGVLVIVSCFFWERTIKIDDPVGAISVHGVNGAWGILSVGLFADGTYGTGWNGSFWYKLPDGSFRWLAAKPENLPDGWIEQGVTGLLFGNSSQLTASLIGIAANIVWVFVTAYIAFYVIEMIVGNRVSAKDEIGGVDIPEMGVLGYISDDPAAGEAHTGVQLAEPRPARVPPDGKNRYTLVLEGITPERISALWSDLCKPGETPPSPDFLAIYSKMTSLKGNRFTFSAGDAATTCSALTKLFQKATNTNGVKATMES